MDGLFFGPGVIAMNRFSDWGALRALVVACVLAVSGSVAAQPQTTEAIWRDPAGLIVIDLAASGAAAISSPPKAMVQNQLARFTLDPFTGAPHCFVDREALDIAEMTPEQTFALFRRLIMERRAFQESLRGRCAQWRGWGWALRGPMLRLRALSSRFRGPQNMTGPSWS
jgi:dienelactone hydrolase